MRIYASSDFHGNLPQVPDCDVFLVVGDICPDFGERGSVKLNSYGLETSGLQQAEWLDSTFRAWLNDLVARGIKVVAIWGNHDFVGEHPGLVNELYLPWTLLQDDMTVIGDLRIWGTPWCPRLRSWAFYAREEALMARAFSIPSCDILMTHSPPLGAGDMVGEYYGGPERVGDEALQRALKAGKIDAKVVLCGHIHEDHGRHHLEGVHPDIVNVSYVNERYEPSNPPVEVLEFSYPN